MAFRTFLDRTRPSRRGGRVSQPCRQCFGADQSGIAPTFALQHTSGSKGETSGEVRFPRVARVPSSTRAQHAIKQNSEVVIMAPSLLSKWLVGWNPTRPA